MSDTITKIPTQNETQDEFDEMMKSEISQAIFTIETLKEEKKKLENLILKFINSKNKVEVTDWLLEIQSFLVNSNLRASHVLKHVSFLLVELHKLSENDLMVQYKIVRSMMEYVHGDVLDAIDKEIDLFGLDGILGTEEEFDMDANMQPSTEEFEEDEFELDF